MEVYQERVMDEKTDLDLKLTELFKFLNSSEKVKTVSEEELKRMNRQFAIMGMYSDILQERIINFK